MDFTAVWLTLQLATATTAILAAVGLPLAYWLAMTPCAADSSSRRSSPCRWSSPDRRGLLPPDGDRSAQPLSAAYEAATGQRLAFSFPGILLGSLLCNLPFTVRPFLAAFQSMNRRLVEAAWCLGESGWRTFWRVALPPSPGPASSAGSC